MIPWALSGDALLHVFHTTGESPRLTGSHIQFKSGTEVFCLFSFFALVA